MIDLVSARAYSRRPKTPRHNDSDFYGFGGGLNLIESPLSSTPGQCQNALNYEIGFEGGYKRVGGYMQQDGHSSKDDPEYWKLPFAGVRKPAGRYAYDVDYDPLEEEEYAWIEGYDLIEGRTLGGAGALLAKVDTGGYGENLILRNTQFSYSGHRQQGSAGVDYTYWNDDPYSTGADYSAIIDGDYIWPHGEDYNCPALSRFRIDPTTGEHWVRSVGQSFTLAVGDMVYTSLYVKFRYGHSNLPYVEQYAIPTTAAGIRIRLAGADAAWGSGSAVYVDFDIKDGCVYGTSGEDWDAYGVDILEDDVLRIWARTRIVSTAVGTACYFEFAPLQQTAPGVLSLTYSTNTLDYFHAAGAGLVKLPAATGSPHNCVMGYENFNTGSYWSLRSLTVTDNDLVWTSGRYPDFTKLACAAATDTFYVWSRSPSFSYTNNNHHIDMAIGDRLIVEIYAKYTAAGGIDGLFIQPSGIQTYQWGADASYGATGYFRITDGTVYATHDGGSAIYTQNIEEQTIEAVDTDIYKIRFVTKPILYAAKIGVQIGLLVDSASATDATGYFDGTGLYTHITGAVVTVQDYTGETKFAIPITDTASKLCETGELILGGSAPGNYQDSEDLWWATVDSRTGYSGLGDYRWIREYFGQSRGSLSKNSEADPTLATTYETLAATNAAETDGKPPGFGPIRGVWMHRGKAYCFRDSFDGNETWMWEATGVGWRQTGHYFEIPFDAGTGAEPSPNDEIRDTINLQRARVHYVDTRSGTWGVDAAGVIYAEPYAIDSLIEGKFLDGNTLYNVTTAANFATMNGDGAFDNFTAGGHYEFRNGNLYGSTDRDRMYFVSGVTNAYEFDSVYGVKRKVVTGMTVDTPNHLAIHNYHLFLSFPGGSIQLSGDGDPHSWTVITGATEIAVGDECTGFNEEVGNSLFIFTRNKSFVLQGSTRANFSLDDFNINAGAHAFSVQRIGMGLFFDDRGFTSMLQTQRADSVNFQENAESELIQPLVEDLVRNAEVTCSHLIRNQNIYRCYFDDGRIVSIGFNKHKVAGHMPLSYPFTAHVACSEEDGQGAERILVGTTEGYVYELERGTDFDGSEVRAFIRSVLYHSKTPGRMKKYNYCRVDGLFRSTLTLGGQIEYDFGNPELNLAETLDFSNRAAGGYWDDMVWDQFVWDETKAGNPQVKLEGEGTNVAIYIFSTSAIDLPHTLRGVTLQWNERRTDRRVI